MHERAWWVWDNFVRVTKWDKINFKTFSSLEMEIFTSFFEESFQYV